MFGLEIRFRGAVVTAFKCLKNDCAGEEEKLCRSYDRTR